MVWRVLALMLTRWFWLQNLIIGAAMKRPYFHLTGYMDRWWLLPGAAADDPKSQYRPPWWLRRLPISIRLHHIKRPDGDRHLHDHPCDFRSIILSGYYVEERIAVTVHDYGVVPDYGRARLWRRAGETYFASATEYHAIVAMPATGVWTLFVMYQSLGPGWNRWGFLVDGKKVPWREYLKEHSNE